MPDDTIMHVQFSSGLTAYILKRVVNTSNLHGNNVNDALTADRNLFSS